MSTTDVSRCRIVKMDKFYAAVAQKLIDCHVTQAGLGELQPEAMYLQSICP